MVFGEQNLPLKHEDSEQSHEIRSSDLEKFVLSHGDLHNTELDQGWYA